MQRITPRPVRPGPTGQRSLMKVGAARPLSRAINAAAAADAGTGRLNMSHIPNTNDYLNVNTTEIFVTGASSYKPQAASVSITDLSPKLQASSLKPQATSC